MRDASGIMEGLPAPPDVISAPTAASSAATIAPVRCPETAGRPGDDFTRRGDIRPILFKHGWKLDQPGENEKWTRPGKDAGTSATLRDGVFFVFTSSTPEFEAGKGYSQFQVLTILEYGGDFTKAAAALRAEGYGTGVLSNVDLSGILSSLHTTSDATWPRPIPFDFIKKLPAFPIESIEPAWLQDTIIAVAESTQTPQDLPGSIALAILGLCGAGKLRVSINESWSEPLNIFTVCSLPPGCRKSAVFAALVDPLITWEQNEGERLKPKIAEESAAFEVEEQILKELKTKAAKEQDATKRAKLIQDAQNVAVSLATKTLPLIPRLFTDDVTPEQLARLLCEHNGRFAVLSPEAEIFEIIAGRYSEGSNIGCFLKGHAGDALRVDRVGRAADYVDKPALTVALACQPDVIEGLSSKPGFRGRGLLGRFLYSLPESPLGGRDVDAAPIPAHISAEYQLQITRLLNLPWNISDFGARRPHVNKLSAEARSLHRDFQKELEPKLAVDGEFGSMTDWAGKLAGAIARIAAGLHLAKVTESPWLAEISSTSMSTAIDLGNYFTVHAQSAYNFMGTDPDVRVAKRILAWIERKRENAFSRRDLCRDFSLETSDVDVGLKLLIEHDFIRLLAPPVKEGSGRKPGPSFEVNPQFLNTMSA